jgi:prefoldin subunit 5
MEKETFFARLGRAFLGVLRFLTVLVLLAVIGAAVWFGVPALYERYIQPLEANTTRLESQIATQDEQIAALQNQVLALQERLGRLETSQTETGQAVSDLQAADQALERQISSLQTGLEQIAALQSETARLAADLEDIANAQGETTQRLDAIVLRLQLLSVTDLLTRARLYMVQNNYGLAKADIQRAIAVLQPLETADSRVSAVRADLEASAVALPGQPVSAADHLDIAWEQLIRLVPSIEPSSPAAEAEATTPTPSTP